VSEKICVAAAHHRFAQTYLALFGWFFFVFLGFDVVSHLLMAAHCCGTRTQWCAAATQIFSHTQAHALGGKDLLLAIWSGERGVMLFVLGIVCRVFSEEIL
jgi:hypothetical protein